MPIPIAAPVEIPLDKELGCGDAVEDATADVVEEVGAVEEVESTEGLLWATALVDAMEVLVATYPYPGSEVIVYNAVTAGAVKKSF